jgi:hypothetical protein
MRLELNIPRGLSPELLKGFCLLHQLEGWFREMVYLELKAHFGLNWWQQAEAALKRSKRPGIRPENL